MNSSLAAYATDMFHLEFAGGCNGIVTATPDEYDESIELAQEMLQHAIDMNDKSEIKQWRESIQRMKVEKRLSKVESKSKENMQS